VFPIVLWEILHLGVGSGVPVGPLFWVAVVIAGIVYRVKGG
jgi:hypothetical protein